MEKWVLLLRLAGTFVWCLGLSLPALVSAKADHDLTPDKKGSLVATNQEKLQWIEKKIRDTDEYLRSKSLLLPLDLSLKLKQDGVQSGLVEKTDEQAYADYPTADQLLLFIADKKRSILTYSEVELSQMMGSLELLDYQNKLTDLGVEMIEALKQSQLQAAGINQDLSGSLEQGSTAKGGASSKALSQALASNSSGAIGSPSQEEGSKESQNKKPKGAPSYDPGDWLAALGELGFSKLKSTKLDFSDLAKLKFNPLDLSRLAQGSKAPSSQTPSKGISPSSSASGGLNSGLAGKRPFLFDSAASDLSPLLRSTAPLSREDLQSGNENLRQYQIYRPGELYQGSPQYQRPSWPKRSAQTPPLKKAINAHGAGIPISVKYPNGRNQESHCQMTAMEPMEGESPTLGCTQPLSPSPAPRPLHFLTARHCVTQPTGVEGQAFLPMELKVATLGQVPSSTLKYLIHPTQDLAIITIEQLPCDKANALPRLELAEQRPQPGTALLMDGRKVQSGQVQSEMSQEFEGLVRMKVSGMGIYPGDSGGPVEVDGKLVGATSSVTQNNPQVGFYAGNLSWVRQSVTHLNQQPSLSFSPGGMAQNRRQTPSSSDLTHREASSLGY